MKRPITAIGISLIIGCLTQAVILNPAYGADRKPAPTRLPTDPGTPALIPAGPNAAALAKSAQKKTSPSACTLFGKECVPDNPVGACMVSSEGTCRIWHQYGGQLDLR